ncbi:MAG: hypothetical protein KKC46_15125 [Proteobacteria bacterium]|nr:hypothetical protein [Pseudomonadota bacterium]
MINVEHPIKFKLYHAGRTFSLTLLLLVLVIGIFQVQAVETDRFYPYITTTLPMPGFVKKLIIPKKTPNFLFALVQYDAKPKPTDKAGLYIFDISDIAKIKQITYVTIQRKK